jgi:hypothetical protein
MNVFLSAVLIVTLMTVGLFVASKPIADESNYIAQTVSAALTPLR